MRCSKTTTYRERAYTSRFENGTLSSDIRRFLLQIHTHVMLAGTFISKPNIRICFTNSNAYRHLLPVTTDGQRRTEFCRSCFFVASISFSRVLFIPLFFSIFVSSSCSTPFRSSYEKHKRTKPNLHKILPFYRRNALVLIHHLNFHHNL